MVKHTLNLNCTSIIVPNKRLEFYYGITNLFRYDMQTNIHQQSSFYVSNNWMMCPQNANISFESLNLNLNVILKFSHE